MNSPKISIIVVSLDNPEYFDLLMKGLVRNVSSSFEVLLHMNAVSTSFESIASKWSKAGHISITTKSSHNEGIYAPANRLFRQARGEYFSFLEDDHYPAPGWDTALLAKVDPNKKQYLSSILFQPAAASRIPSAEKEFNLKSFGKDALTFDEDSFNSQWKEARNITEDTYISGGNFFMRADFWRELGGYDDTRFIRPGGDVDFLMQAKHLGETKYAGKFEFRAVADSCLYHFAHIGNNKTGYFNTSPGWKELFIQKWGQEPPDVF